MAQPIEYALRFISQALKKEQEARAFATESILNAIRKYFSADNKKKRNIATEKKILKAIEQDKNTVLGFYLQSIQEKGALNADETLDAEIASAIAVLANTEEEITTETLSKIAHDSYDRAVHEGWLKGSIKAIALTLAGYKLQQSMVQKGIERAWSGDTYKNRIYKRFFKLSNKLKEEAVKAKQYGRDVKDVERTIKSYMDSDAKHGMPTLLETEANAVHSFFRVEAFKKTGVENYRFDAKLDSKTSDICSRMDGKIFALKDAQSGVNCPAMHPRCRSDIQAVYKDEYLAHDGKKIKMPDGKYITVDRNMAYEKWRETYRSDHTINDDIDFARREKVHLPNGTSFTAVRNVKVKHEIWHEQGLYNANKLDKKLDETLGLIAKKYKDIVIPKVIVTKAETLDNGIAGYDHATDVLYINENSFNSRWLRNLLEGRFSANNLEESLLHELGHKAHWDSVQRVYKRYEKQYNSLIEAKEDLEKEVKSLLLKMSDEQLLQYLSPYGRKNLEKNEPYAEWFLRFRRDGTCGNDELDKKMKEVFGL